jgi:hypothetical protein
VNADVSPQILVLGFTVDPLYVSDFISNFVPNLAVEMSLFWPNGWRFLTTIPALRFPIQEVRLIHQ